MYLVIILRSRSEVKYKVRRRNYMCTVRNTVKINSTLV